MTILRTCICVSLAMSVAIACGGSSGSFVVVSDSGSSDGAVAGQGMETGACYPNGTCNAGLVCLSNFCAMPGDRGADGSADSLTGAAADAVTLDQASSDTETIDASAGETSLVDAALNDGGAGEASAGDTGASDAVAADARDEAGLPCPGATILHPGPQTRTAGMSVPFVGRARDASCAPITGLNLVWTDSLEGPIGNGETFSHTFIIMGSHTVTLRATDSLGRMYTATVTFMIV